VSAALDLLSTVLVVTGASFVLLASVGLHRFDDLFSRIHAATKATTLGLLLAALGASLQVVGAGNAAKLLLACLLQLVSAPVSAHMVGRAAYGRGAELSPTTEVDQLAEDLDGPGGRPVDG
jgi:multicomponent Na+:H+ antiporter subunit G